MIKQYHPGGLWEPEEDGDCSHEIKRHLLLGRKVMTHLDSILRSRDITLPTKVHLVKEIRDTKGKFHAKMGTIKDRNYLGLKEAEEIKKM